LPHLKVMSLEVVRKLRDLVRSGAVVVGAKPQRCTGHQDDAELQRIADELWDGGTITPRPAREALASLKVAPDLEGIADWIHRRLDDGDVYFVSNQKADPFHHDCVFRVAGTKPELWDPVSGTCHEVPEFRAANGRTTLMLDLPAYGSMFLVFRKPDDGKRAHPVTEQVVAELAGPWEVTFGIRTQTFDKLADWTTRPDVRYFSGTANYRKSFDAPNSAGRLLLDLGSVSMLAEIYLNGKNLGVVWCPPWRVDITNAVKPAGNVLEVHVVNGWWNQLVGDPQHQHTETNIRLKPGATPQESGLLGPVRLYGTW